MTKLRILRWQIILDYPVRLNVVTRGLKNRKRCTGSRGTRREIRRYDAGGFEDGGWAMCQGRQTASKTWGRQVNWFFPKACRRNAAPRPILGLLTSQTVRELKNTKFEVICGRNVTPQETNICTFYLGFCSLRTIKPPRCLFCLSCSFASYPESVVPRPHPNGTPAAILPL